MGARVGRPLDRAGSAQAGRAIPGHRLTAALRTAVCPAPPGGHVQPHPLRRTRGVRRRQHVGRGRVGLGDDGDHAGAGVVHLVPAAAAALLQVGGRPTGGGEGDGQPEGRAERRRAVVGDPPEGVAVQRGRRSAAGAGRGARCADDDRPLGRGHRRRPGHRRRQGRQRVRREGRDPQQRQGERDHGQPPACLHRPCLSCSSWCRRAGPWRRCRSGCCSATGCCWRAGRRWWWSPSGPAA